MQNLRLFPNTKRRYHNKAFWVNRRVNMWPPAPPPPPPSDGLKDKKVAIIFFGLTRSLGRTVDSIKNNLFEPLRENGMSYDIFVHTYKIFGEYQNIWAREHTSNYINEDVNTLLNPKYFIWDDQKKVERSINFNEYYKKLGNWTFGGSAPPGLIKYLIKNMCLALYSKKKIIEIFDKNKGDYDYAIIIRPDLRLDNKLDIRYLNVLNRNNIIVPRKEWWWGCNDRICIGKPETISYCGKLFDGLKSYSERKSIISERYFLDKLREKSILPIGLNIEYTALRITK